MVEQLAVPSYDVLSRAVTRRVALTAGGVAFLLFALPPVFGAYYFSRDLALYDAGVFCELRRILGLGESVLLSPVLGNGTPLLADPQAQILYPPRWLALLMPAEWGISFLVAFHLAVAAASMAWLSRTFRLPPGLSVLAGLAFALTGTVLDLIGHAAYIVGAAYLPLAWAAVRSVLLHRGSRTSLLLLALALVGCLLGGEPQSLGIALGLALVEVLFALPNVGSRSKLPRVALVAVGAVLIGLSAWWPTFEEMRLSPRAVMPMKMLMAWPFQPEGWLASLIPGFLTERIAAGENFWRLLNGRLVPPPWNPTPYFGALLLLASLAAFGLRGKRSAVVVFSGAVLLSLGDQTPVLPLLTKVLPALGLFRYPAKYLVVATIAAVILGFSAIHNARVPSTRRVMIAGSSCVIAWFAAASLIAFLFREQLDGLLEQSAPGAVYEALWHMLRQGALPVAAGLALVVFRRRRRWLGALVVFDLLMAAPMAVNVGPGFFSHPSPLRDLGSEAIVCVAQGLSQVSVSAGEPDSTWEQLFMNRTLNIGTFGGCGSVTTGHSYSALTTAMNLALGTGVARGNERAARALGCTHIVALDSSLSDRLEEVPIERLKVRVGPHDRVSVRKIPSAIPPVFVVDRPVLVDSAGLLLKGISFSEDARSVVRGVDDPLKRLDGTALPAGREVELASYDWPRRERASVTLRGEGGAVVGLRTSFQAGWTAEQAGRPLQVVRAAGSHVAAVVPDASLGPVEFEYRLPGRKRAAASVLAGAFALVLGLGMPFRSRRMLPAR